MNETISEFLKDVSRESQERSRALDRVLSAADPSKVFSQPVTSGEYTVITASEVAAGGGFGSGMGFGLPGKRRKQALEEAGTETGSVPDQAGGGGGGGGGSMGRPVAAIVISADGVEVKPVIDVTKVSLAALTAFGAAGILLLKMLSKR